MQRSIVFKITRFISVWCLKVASEHLLNFFFFLSFFLTIFFKDFPLETMMYAVNIRPHFLDDMMTDIFGNYWKCEKWGHILSLCRKKLNCLSCVICNHVTKSQMGDMCRGKQKEKQNKNQTNTQNRQNKNKNKNKKHQTL